MNKKTLAICGDSWFSTDLRQYGNSFGEIIASKYDLQLENLARTGCSNFGISLQVDKAIQMNPDFIIVGCTGWDRMELPIKKQTGFIKQFLNFIDWPSNARSIAAYNKDRGLLNVKYSHDTVEMSSNYSQPNEETIICESINNIVWTNRYNIDSETLSALEQYLVHIYDSGVKQQIDCWIISDAVRRLFASGIPFLVYTEPLYNHDFISDIQWVDPKYRVMYNDFSYYTYPMEDFPVYHLTADNSKDFAAKWEARLIKEGFLNG